MDIRPYESDMAKPVSEAYNRLVRGVTHCVPVTPEALDAAVRHTAGQARSDGDVTEKGAWVAFGDGGLVMGFADVGLGTPKPDREQQGVIRMLWYERGHRAVGSLLLTAAESHLTARGATRVQAFPQEYRYDVYHLHSAYLSDRLDHVAALLAHHGYEQTRGEVYLDWPDFTPLALAPFGHGVEIVAEHIDREETRPGIRIRALLGSEQVGICECESCAEATRAESEQDWCCTHWLGVEETWRGMGLGKHLLRSALVEARACGYRHAVISTAWWNTRARLFYSNVGYRVVDWTYGYSRDLT